MSALARFIWVITILAFLSGCTSYRHASLPGAPVDTAANENSHFVKVGSRVKVTLTGGEVVTGEVLQVSGNELVLTGDGNYGYSERSLSTSDIVAIEMEYTSSSDKKKNVEIVLFSVLALGIAAYIGFVNAMEGMN